MPTMHADLLLLAVVAQAHGVGQVADNLYGLAHYGSNVTPTMSAADVQVGLSLMGVDSYRLVAPDLTVPDLIQDGIERGHICLAQIRAGVIGKRDQWVILCRVSAGAWDAIAMTGEWAQCSVSSRLGCILTGFYVIASRPLPGWNDPSS